MDIKFPGIMYSEASLIRTERKPLYSTRNVYQFLLVLLSLQTRSYIQYKIS